MRKLNVEDIFNAMQLADLFDMKKVYDRMKSLNKKDAQSVGMNAFFILLKEASNDENRNRIYEFLSGPFEMKAEDIKTLDAIEFGKMIVKIASIEEWMAFIKSLQA